MLYVLGERKKERVCVCKCVCVREKERMCVWERVWEKERECVCVRERTWVLLLDHLVARCSGAARCQICQRPLLDAVRAPALQRCPSHATRFYMADSSTAASGQGSPLWGPSVSSPVIMFVLWHRMNPITLCQWEVWNVLVRGSCHVFSAPVPVSSMHASTSSRVDCGLAQSTTACLTTARPRCRPLSNVCTTYLIPEPFHICPTSSDALAGLWYCPVWQPPCAMWLRWWWWLWTEATTASEFPHSPNTKTVAMTAHEATAPWPHILLSLVWLFKTMTRVRS